MFSARKCLLKSPKRCSRIAVPALCLCALSLCRPLLVPAAEVEVRHIEGAVSGFLSLRTVEGKTLALGDLSQVTHAGLVTSRVVFHFKDGSLDDETTVFSQHHTFRLVSDHHVQSGPSFPHPADVMIDAAAGVVIVRSPGKDGKEKLTSQRMEIPSDLANGLMLILLKNLGPTAADTQVSYLTTAVKPRLIKLAIGRAGLDQVTIGGIHRKAMNYDIKVDLGGIAGVVAPLIGKRPEDIHVWMVGTAVPAFVGFEGQCYEGGPLWRIESAVPSWPIKQ